MTTPRNHRSSGRGSFLCGSGAGCGRQIARQARGGGWREAGHQKPNREDHKLWVEKLLAELDPEFISERNDPDFQSERAQRTHAFSVRAQAGQATVQELITALRELPEAIPTAAQALGAIGFEEMSRRARESPQAHEGLVQAGIMLTQVAGSNEPLESRLAAARAFQQLQPTRERLLYTVQETAPAFAVITAALPQLSQGEYEQIASRFNAMLEQAKLMSTVQQRPGEVTDYQGAFVESFARELSKIDGKLHRDFVAAMRKADPKFPRWRP